jgi:hypothetical protein
MSKKTRKLHSFMRSTAKEKKIIHVNKLILQIKNKKKVFYKKKKLLKLFLKQGFGAKKKKKNKKRL